MPTIYTLSRPGRVLQEVRSLHIVPITRPDGEPGYVIAFEEHEYVNHRTGRIAHSPETRIVVVETQDDLGSPRVLSESHWLADGRLITGVALEQADGTERRMRCALLESELRLEVPTDADELKAFQAAAENFVKSLLGLGSSPAPPELLRMSRHYLVRDPLAQYSHEFLTDEWPGKATDADYRPIGAGGKITDGDYFVVLAERSSSPTVDQFDYALVALRLDSADFHVSAELQLDTVPTTGAAGSPFDSCKITPVSDGPNDGWIVVQALGGSLIGYNIAPDVSSSLGPSTILPPPTAGSTAPFLPPGVDPESVRVAGAMVAATRSGVGSVYRRGTYMAAFTSPPTLRTPASSSAVVGFSWSTRPSAGVPVLSFAQTVSHGPSGGPSALAFDTRTDCHWYLLDWGSIGEPLSIEAQPDSDSVVVSPPSGDPSRFGSARLRFSRIGHVGRAYWRTHTFDPPTLIPHASCAAAAFDHRRDAVVVGFQSTTGEENRVVAQLHQSAYSGVLALEPGECPSILPRHSDPNNAKTFPIAGNQFFTVSLENGPPTQAVSLWIGLPFRVRTSGPCDFFLRTDDPGTRRFRARTDALGNASLQVQLSEAQLPRIFDINPPEVSAFGAILDHPTLLIAQWSWWDYAGIVPEVVVGGFGDPERGTRLDVMTGNSSPLFLFVTSGYGW